MNKQELENKLTLIQEAIRIQSTKISINEKYS
jgi:hypothetical protein